MQTVNTALLAAVALIPAVSAHGYVSNIISGGKSYIGSNPNWYYQPAGQVVPTAGWFAMNQDNGFVAPDLYDTSNISCHKQAKPGTLSVPVKAGETVQLQWNTWPDSHHGPVLDYLAEVESFSTASAGSLVWNKIAQGGLINDDSPPGQWESDLLIADNFTHTVTIPKDLAAGNYVLRTEIIALHAAGSADGAQNYPQCVNIQVSGSGTVKPSGGTVPTALYKENDPGILIDIYSKISNYVIPGPAITLKKRDAVPFTA